MNHKRARIYDPWIRERVFRISNPCVECDGSGEVEVQHGVDSFAVRDCDSCWGNGYRVIRETYPSASAAAADFPRAIKIEEASNMTQETSNEYGTRTQVMTITPILAQQWLDGASDFKNRRVKDTVILKYARDMESGIWQVNGETIKFAHRNGAAVMIDGQHRALACVKSGSAFTSLVVFGVDEATYHSMDSGTVRQPADFLQRSGSQYVHSVVAAARMIFANGASGNPTTRTRTSVATNQEILAIVANTPELERSAVALYKVAGGHSKLLPPSLAVYLFYRFGQIDTNWRDSFFEGLYRGVGLTEKSPILALRNRLIDDLTSVKKTTLTVKSALAIKGWNAFVEGREVSLLRWFNAGPSQEKFPTISEGK
jgi:hypothetical protein